jgi:hypothetical protein
VALPHTPQEELANRLRRSFSRSVRTPGRSTARTTLSSASGSAASVQWRTDSTSAHESTTRSVSRKPLTSSTSSPGVRITTASAAAPSWIERLLVGDARADSINASAAQLHLADGLSGHLLVGQLEARCLGHHLGPGRIPDRVDFTSRRRRPSAPWPRPRAAGSRRPDTSAR